MRVGHDSYGLVALVLDDKLSAGLNHARHRHVYGRIARTGPHHSFVDIGNQNLIGSCWWLPAGVDEHLKAGREHIGRNVYVDFYFGFGCHLDLAGPRASALAWPTPRPPRRGVRSRNSRLDLYFSRAPGLRAVGGAF